MSECTNGLYSDAGPHLITPVAFTLCISYS